MKEPHIEGLATHDDPESCAVVRKDGGEALTGAHTGWVLSRGINASRVPTLFYLAEGHMSSGGGSGVSRVPGLEPCVFRTPSGLVLPHVARPNGDETPARI